MERKKYFFEAFDNMERLGPGSAESTKRALDFYPATKSPMTILDIGCGVGTHTFLLAEKFPNADITAIDSHAPYIEQVNKKANEKGIANKVRGILMSMFEMTFANESFDLIWSEGAIYIAGFERGIKEWKKLLKHEGYLVCSEITWLTDSPSEECNNFWTKGYSEMDTIDNKLKTIISAGYCPKGYYVCPVTDWTTNFYDFLQKNLDGMKRKYSDNDAILEIVNDIECQIGIYNRNSHDYSYVFYAMERL